MMERRRRGTFLILLAGKLAALDAEPWGDEQDYHFAAMSQLWPPSGPLYSRKRPTPPSASPSPPALVRDKACNLIPSVLDIRRAFVSEELSLVALQRTDPTAQQELSPAVSTGVKGSVFGIAFALNVEIAAAIKELLDANNTHRG